MVNNTAIAIVILNNRNLLVYFVFSAWFQNKNKQGIAAYNFK